MNLQAGNTLTVAELYDMVSEAGWFWVDYQDFAKPDQSYSGPVTIEYVDEDSSELRALSADESFDHIFNPEWFEHPDGKAVESLDNCFMSISEAVVCTDEQGETLDQEIWIVRAYNHRDELIWYSRPVPFLSTVHIVDILRREGVWTADPREPAGPSLRPGPDAEAIAASGEVWNIPVKDISVKREDI